LEIERRARKELDQFIKDQEEEWDFGISELRRDLLNHISDFSYWLPTMEDNEDLKVDSKLLYRDSKVAKLSITEQTAALDTALTENMERFKRFLDHKSQEGNAVTIEIETKDPLEVVKPKENKRVKKSSERQRTKEISCSYQYS